MGTGHVMRSSAIAEEAIAKGIECIFVGEILGVPWLEKRINELGFSRYLQPTQILEVSGADSLLILDSYVIDPMSVWLDTEKWAAVVSIADELTPSYPANLVVHPGLGGDWYKGEPTNFLFGPNFIPLRKSVRASERVFKPEIEKITIFGGGSDAYGFASTIATELAKEMKFKHVVIYSDEGPAISRIDSRFTIKPFGRTLDEDIEASDLVLTTASTSSLEVIARAIPIGIACAVDNQFGYFEKLGNLGVATQIGERIKTGNWNIYSSNLSRLLGDFDFRRSLINASSNLINFNGSRNILDEILKL